jgi:hypothetical protein
MTKAAEIAYAEAINRAAMMLLAMAFVPKLKHSLVDEIITAIDIRGGRIDGRWIIRWDLHDVFEIVTERAMAILSAALRERLPGIADEMDDAFGHQLHLLLASTEYLIPILK